MEMEMERGFWNIHKAGQWYQIYDSVDEGWIASPEDPETYNRLKTFQDRFIDFDTLAGAVRRPFPLPLREDLWYIYTLDLDEGWFAVTFWHSEVEDDDDLRLFVRRLELDGIQGHMDLILGRLLEGCDPFAGVSVEELLGEGEDGVRLKCGNWILGLDDRMNDLTARLCAFLKGNLEFPNEDSTIIAMVTRGWWNIRSKGQWYQYHPEDSRICRIFSADRQPTWLNFTKFRYGTVDMEKLDRATPIPFPFPLRQGYDYVYTLDRDEGHFTISFWCNEEDDESSDVRLCMRREDIEDVRGPIKFKGMNSLLEFTSLEIGEKKEYGDEFEFEDWNIKIEGPTSLNELQYRMFTDFVYQWRFFIDDRTIWPSSSSTLFRRLCWGFLRIAAWDLEISTEGGKAKLPLGAEDFPAWECPGGQIYWFHGWLVVLCQALRGPFLADGVKRAKQFLGERKMEVECIFFSLKDIAFLRISAEKTKCSRRLPFLTELSGKEISPGFRVLTSLLTSHSNKNRAEREKSNIKLPLELLNLVLTAISAYDILSFAQASFKVKEWYYDSFTLPQLPRTSIFHQEVSIPCCGERDGGEGVYCSICYIWVHLRCMPSSKDTTELYTCPSCLLLSLSIDSSSEQKRGHLEPGAISRLNRGSRRPKGAHVHLKHPADKKILQLRATAPALQRPEIRMMDPHLRNTPPNLIDYVVLFGGVWTGLAYGLDALDSVVR